MIKVFRHFSVARGEWTEQHTPGAGVWGYQISRLYPLIVNVVR